MTVGVEVQIQVQRKQQKTIPNISIRKRVKLRRPKSQKNLRNDVLGISISRRKMYV